MADEQRVEGVMELSANSAALIQNIDNTVAKLKQAEQKLNQSSNNIAKAKEEADKKVIASEKRVVQEVGALRAKMNTDLAKSREKIERQRGSNIRGRVSLAEAEAGGRVDLAKTRGEYRVKEELIKRDRDFNQASERRLTIIANEESKKRLHIFRQEANERRRIGATLAAEERRILDRAILAPAGTRDKVQQLISTPQMRRRRDAMIGFGLTPKEAILSQLSEGFGLEEAQFLSGTASARPVSLGGKDTEGERAAKAQLRELNQRVNKANLAIRREYAQIERVINRSLLAPVEVQEKVAAALKGGLAAMQRRAAVAGGATQQQAIIQNLTSAGFAPAQATFLASGQGRRPVALGGRPPAGGAGGGRGFWGGLGGRLAGLGGGGAVGSIAGGLLGGFGVGLGGYAVANAARGVVEATQQATAYERQTIAAENLAGSQAKLNALLDSYTKASGGAVNLTTTLSNVTRLLATGFADSAPEVERFVRATRGASIALGKPQDYVIQETQLAISNTSVKRLDQIGLGIQEVNDKIKELRATNTGWSREMAFQDAVLTLMDEKYGTLTRTVEGQATEVEKLAKEWDDLRLTMGQAAKGPVEEISSWLSGLLQILDTLIKVNQEVEKNKRWSGGQNMGPFFSPWLMGDQPGAVGIDTGRFIESSAARDRGRHPARTTKLFQPRFREDQLSVIQEGYDSERQIIESAAKARNELVAQYEEQRTQTAASFAKQMVREEEDFARQRVRGLRDYERSILEIMRDAQEREAEMQKDLDKVIAESREDSEKRISELQENYNEEREKSEKKHREAMLKAAGQLDAIAILEERKRFREEQKERDEQHDKAVEKERESLQERIDDAVEAHQERLEDAREADRKRLEDMRITRAQQLADEDEDRALRKQRAIDDHNEQLAEMDRQHDAAMERIAEEQAEQEQLLKDALAADLAAVGIYVEGYHEKMAERDKLIEEWFDKFVAKLEKELYDENHPATEYNPDSAAGPRLSYQSGGPVHRTGPAILHAGEYVLSREMLASGFSPVTNSSSMSDNSKRVSIENFIIQTTPGMEMAVGEQLEEALIRLLDES